MLKICEKIKKKHEKTIKNEPRNRSKNEAKKVPKTGQADNTVPGGPRDTKKDPKWPPLASFWPPCGAPLASLGLPLAFLGPPLAAQWPPLVSLSLPSPPFGHPVASLWLPEASLGHPFSCQLTKTNPKWYQNGPQNRRESITNQAKKGEDQQSREEPHRDAQRHRDTRKDYKETQLEAESSGKTTRR